MSAADSSTTVSDAPRWRVADLSVLVLLIVAVTGGLLLRGASVNATQPASFEGLSFEVPRNSLVSPATGADTAPRYAATSTNGLAVQVEKIPMPPTGGEDLGALITMRVLQQGKNKTLFQSTATDETEAAGRTSGVLDYQYVESSNQIFATGLRILQGREVLVPDGDSFYAVSLEAPSDRAEGLDPAWSRLVSSLQLGS